MNVATKVLCLAALVSLLACGQAANDSAGSDDGASSASEPPPVPENVDGPPESAERSDSGLAWEVLAVGRGDRHPAPEDEVTVHYTGWQTDGTMFDSSVVRGEPATFRLGNLIEGWVEGLQLMTEGERRRFWIPG